MSKKNVKKTKAAKSTSDAVAKAAKNASDGQARAKASKTVRQAEPKRVCALDAAATVLKAAGQPMRARELIEAMAERGLWSSPGGKTPHATLYAAILREIATRGKEARFAKVERGQFEFAGKGA